MLLGAQKLVYIMFGSKTYHSSLSRSLAPHTGPSTGSYGKGLRRVGRWNTRTRSLGRDAWWIFVELDLVTAQPIGRVISINCDSGRGLNLGFQVREGTSQSWESLKYVTQARIGWIVGGCDGARANESVARGFGTHSASGDEPSLPLSLKLANFRDVQSIETPAEGGIGRFGNRVAQSLIKVISPGTSITCQPH